MALINEAGYESGNGSDTRTRENAENVVSPVFIGKLGNGKASARASSFDTGEPVVNNSDPSVGLNAPVVTGTSTIRIRGQIFPFHKIF